MTVNAQHFREILDEMEIAHRAVPPNGFEFIIEQTGPFQGKVKFTFFVREEQALIQAYAVLCNKDLDASKLDEAYRFCNTWHNDTIMPKVIVDEKNRFLLCEWIWDSDYEISNDLLTRLILAPFIQNTQTCINKAVEAGLYPGVNRQVASAAEKD